MAAAVTVFDKQGVHDRAVKKWQRTGIADQSWELLEEEFKRSENEWRNSPSYKTANESANAATEKASADGAKENAAPNGKRFEHNNNNRRYEPRKDHGCVVYYCWSCGYNFSPGHTSQLCGKRLDGHKENADVRNRQGGKDGWFKRQPRANGGSQA